MGMALKKDVLAACRNAGTEKPVDLVHLSSVTMGDRSLEREILGMFNAQMPDLLGSARSCKTAEEVKRVAHTIKGAARSIGAFRLAEHASTWEKVGQFEFDQLESEFSAISGYISSLK